MTLVNLSYIGHCGNFIIEDGELEEAGSYNNNNKKSLYDFDNRLELGGTGDVLGGHGILNVADTEIAQIEQTFNTALTGSHNIKMITFGLDSIFGAAQASPFMGLETLGLLKYVDLSALTSGFRLPAPASLFPRGKGR